MQLTKNSHYDSHELFPDHLLAQEGSSPHPTPLPADLIPRGAAGEEQEGGRQNPSAEQNEHRFYQQFKKIYTVSHHLSLEKERQFSLWQTLNKRIRSLEQKLQGSQERRGSQVEEGEESKIKRARRTAQEIEKRFKCEVPYCERLYGSEGSLQQHIKLKHPHLYLKSQSDSSMAPPQELSL